MGVAHPPQTELPMFRKENEVSKMDINKFHAYIDKLEKRRDIWSENVRKAVQSYSAKGVCHEYDCLCNMQYIINRGVS